MAGGADETPQKAFPSTAAMQPGRNPGFGPDPSVPCAMVRQHGAAGGVDTGKVGSMRSQDPRWFPRFADVPGVRYSAPAGLDVARLKQRNVRPTVNRWPDMAPSLSWPMPGGSTSQAPAGGHHLEEPRKATTARVLRNLAEALELPGEAADYHFAIQEVVSLLWSRRAEEPQAFAEMERLCWLDIQLVQAFPDAVTYEHRDGGTQFVSITTFRTLLDLYLTEGALGEAAQVLELADRFGNGDTPSARRARERCAAFAAEDIGR